MGSHFLLQEIFLTRESDPCLLHWQVDSLPSKSPGRPPLEVLSANKDGACKRSCHSNISSLLPTTLCLVCWVNCHLSISCSASKIMWLSLDCYAFLSHSLCACGLLPSLHCYYYLGVISRDTEVKQGFTLPCLIRSLLLKNPKNFRPALWLSQRGCRDDWKQRVSWSRAVVSKGGNHTSSIRKISEFPFIFFLKEAFNVYFIHLFGCTGSQL